LAPFKERYPFVEVDYSRASYEDRVIKTVVAFRQRRYVTNVITGVGGSVDMFKEADALEDLRGVPNWQNNPEWTKDGGGLWVGMHLRYWCMAYNTKLVKKSDLPKKWEDLLTNPVWRNGNLALGNRPELWPLMLWKSWGEEKAKDFFIRLFRDLKPQLRKEGMNAMLDLLAAGEFHASIPSAEYRTSQKESEGAPVSFTCAEPVPVMTSEMGILKNAPHLNSARLFVNWFLSKEGQLAQYMADESPPVHRELQRREFLPYADEILGKRVSFRLPEDAEKTLPKVRDFWNSLWLGKGAKPAK